MELKNVICSTPQEFHSECEKWAGKSVIRGRKLYAYGEVVAELKTQHQLRTDFTTQLLKASEGYTIQQLSDLTGLDKSNVHKMLNGKSNPSIDTILKVTNALNQDIIVKPRNNK